MRQWLRLVAAVVVCFWATRSSAAVTPSQMQDAIDRGKKYLLGIEKAGNWEINPKPDDDQAGYSMTSTQYTGLTALATYALLASGEPSSDPKMQAAIQWLRTHETKGIYALGLRMQVWGSIPQEQWVRERIVKDRDLLLAGIEPKGPSAGFYDYNTGRDRGDQDKSASQFAVLGLWAAEQAGAGVDPTVWKLFDRVWHAQETPSGGWCYNVLPRDNENSDPTLAMTAAGVATLFITQDYVNASSKCKGNIRDPGIVKGLDWLGDHLPHMTGDRANYTMFGISRVGLASGYKYIGKLDWFDWGATRLLAEQQPDGLWGDPDGPTKGVVDTGFAMLFLARGRAPVLFNKIEYDVVGTTVRQAPSTWNQRPRDVANVTRMIGKALEAQLNWQVVNLHQGKRDLTDAPILFMSGSTAPKLSVDDTATLREYVEQGGMVVANADCGTPAFAQGFRKLGEEMFPGHHFAELPADHPIYSEESFNRSTWKAKPAVEGLDNGGRVLMILFPTGDPAKSWQAQSFQPVKSDVDSQLIIDVVLYAVDKQVWRPKGETYQVGRDDGVKAESKVKVARLSYAGNWNPEPGGWRRLSNVMHNVDRIDLQVDEVDPAKGQLTDGYALAVVTVGGPIEFSDEARKAIAAYVGRGGTLEVDVVGGRSDFISFAQAELDKIVPGASKAEILTADSPFYVKNGGAEVSYRALARNRLGVKHAPRLRGFNVGNRIGVFYGTEDLSVGLVGQPNGGVVGYDPASATKIMSDVVKYAAHH